MPPLVVQCWHHRTRILPPSSPAIPEANTGLQEALHELESLIGLAAVKQTIQEIIAFAAMQRYRRKLKLATEATVFHMIFTGNPGTGKTSVARIMGRLLHHTGLLTHGQVQEVERADLVGEYIGHTAQKTREQLKKAYGGILFVDEAYSLARGGEKDFGKEAIDVLVKALEDHKHDFALILAGYPQEMEGFLQSNPGLRSRFPLHLPFPDYTTEDLLAIAETFCQKHQYRLSPQAKTLLTSRLQEEQLRQPIHFGNARTVRNLLEKAMRQQALRLFHQLPVTAQQAMQLEAADFLPKPEPALRQRRQYK